MRHIAVFAKWPKSGSVKTRLQPVLGPEWAKQLYLAMLHDALAAAAAAGVDRTYAYWADRPEDAAPFPVPAGTVTRDQHGPDLGARLARAFDEMLPATGDRAVILGADCPRIDAAILRQAFDELDRCDVVLAPAGDGGYSLIGLARPAPELFHDMAWSTNVVLGDTLARADRLGRRVTLLARSDDVDAPSDLVAFLARALRAPTVAPHTQAALRAMSLLP
jgi:hypothetical protein